MITVNELYRMLSVFIIKGDGDKDINIYNYNRAEYLEIVNVQSSLGKVSIMVEPE